MSNLTNLQALESAAAEAGDLLQAAICQVAMYGEATEATLDALDDAERAKVASYSRESARAECERIAQ